MREKEIPPITADTTNGKGATWAEWSVVQGYFQEIGRGGRDGLPSECTLFYSAADASAVRFMVGKGKSEGNRKRRQAQLDEVAAPPTCACLAPLVTTTC